MSQIFLLNLYSYGADFQNNKFISFPLFQYKSLFPFGKRTGSTNGCSSKIFTEMMADLSSKRYFFLSTNVC